MRDDVRLWIPIALVGLAVLGYAFFYLLTATETQSATSFYLTNVVGLIVVVVGVIAAGIVIRRSGPPR